MIPLDLTRDLVKVDLKHAATAFGCKCTAPCAVGAMMTLEQRQHLADIDLDSRGVIHCIEVGEITVPADQLHDFVALQDAFDGRDDKFFAEILGNLKEKYLA